MPPRKKVVATNSNAAEDDSAAASGPAGGGAGIDQFELPKSVIARLAKGAVPPEVKLQKEVPLALVKGSTVFINYLAALSHDLATEKNTKTITAAHVLEATKQLGWEDGGKELERYLKKELKGFRKIQEAKKAGTYVAPPRGAAAAAKASTSTNSKGKAKTVVQPQASTTSSKERAESEAAEDEEVSHGDTVLREDRPNEDEENLYPSGGPEEDAEMSGIELYDDDEEEDGGDEAGEGIDEDDGVEEPMGAREDLGLDDIDDEED